MFLSILPGLSLVYVGKFKQALPLFIIDAGIILTVIFSGSYIMKILMAGIYLVTFFPPALESYQLVKYGRNTINTEAQWYVIVLLLTTGFTALPLLWKSGNFSKKAKIAWTVAVPVLAVLFFALLAKYWDNLDDYLKDLLTGP
jgi:hypothetical protein